MPITIASDIVLHSTIEIHNVEYHTIVLRINSVNPIPLFLSLFVNPIFSFSKKPLANNMHKYKVQCTEKKGLKFTITAIS